MYIYNYLYLSTYIYIISKTIYIYLLTCLGVRSRLTECLETILNKAGEPLKSKKVVVGSVTFLSVNPHIRLLVGLCRLVGLP